MRHTRHTVIVGKLLFSPKKVLIESEDQMYFVRPLSLHGRGIHGEKVRAKIVKGADGTRLAEVEYRETLGYSDELLLGRFITRKGRSYFRLLESFGFHETLMPLPKDAQESDIFMCRFMRNGKITLLQKFANNKDFDIEEKILFFTAGVRTEFPPTLERELASLHNALSWNTIVASRRDFRSLYTMTIDGSDAKDLDDAFSLSKNTKGNFVLIVHIADVAEYVRQGSALDTEALARATSIYTPGKVVPMLPEALSNDLCSLHPGTPKLTLSVILELNPQGDILSTEIVEGVIESKKRGVYDDIFTFFTQLPKVSSPDEDREISTIRTAFELYHILVKRRKKEGKILFTSTESVFTFAPDGQPISVTPRTRNAAHMLIEEFMVLANEEVAKWCHRHSIPLLSRIHGEPGKIQQEALEHILSKQKKHLLTPKDIRDFMDTLSDEDEIYRYSRLLLPKMAKATYSEKSTGHFGLALDFYAHFTSPIRRYPDLQLHRIIKEQLHGKLSKERKEQYMRTLKKVAKISSERERRAEDLERSFDALYACRYMMPHRGETFSGRVSGLSEFAIFVELENSIEVTVYLPRGKKFSPGTLDGHLYDAKGKVLYTLGDRVLVRITEVLMGERRIVAEIL